MLTGRLSVARLWESHDEALLLSSSLIIAQDIVKCNDVQCGGYGSVGR